MADKSMKSVIYAEMDTSGITRGVAKTTAELGKLNKTAKSGAAAAGITATLQMTQMAFQGISQVFQGVERRMAELNGAALKYSGAAMGANAIANADKMKADIRIGKAVTPGSIETSQAAGDIATGAAARIERNAGGINAGMGATARFSGNMQASTDMLLESAATALAGVEQMLGGDFSGGASTLGAAGGQLGELGNAQNYASQNTPAPGAQGSAEQIMYLRAIDKSLRGGAQ
ncbi:hypothetical protein UFOVP1209_13 [uncultured Caudovirales phage]|uniref:Uncharacterized protein n=1 Tax=uncultured Caudovirales phage TaxID=2100421 RepID=A0A6J5R7M4_9CAUD|nr:hypothetical protein UFOVP1139_1 [uncultured Caudovirales phage]CAB4189678.1 hypothetical protein UFOVP1209_13 [uncultured Caudovirales phage]CAB4216983.1 hypothetical protein UFOVP1499_7 [uncultured Caudovirales phage]CAB4222192.1 hypothetical protein UFOVP1646_1 [uncultured Caudovirales phage]